MTIYKEAEKNSYIFEVLSAENENPQKVTTFKINEKEKPVFTKSKETSTGLYVCRFSHGDANSLEVFNVLNFQGHQRLFGIQIQTHRLVAFYESIKVGCFDSDLNMVGYRYTLL